MSDQPKADKTMPSGIMLGDILRAAQAYCSEPNTAGSVFGLRSVAYKECLRYQVAACSESRDHPMCLAAHHLPKPKKGKAI